MSMQSSDAAEQVVKIYLEGVEVALKISGEATKNIVAAIYAIAKDKNRTKGKVRLTNMLKSGKDLKIFSIKKYELEKFSKEAKRYGVLYCALLDKKNKDTDDVVDIMVRSEDAPKVNRIVERFKFASLDIANLSSSIGSKEEHFKENNEPKSEEDLLVEELLNKQDKEKNKDNQQELPSTGTEEDNQLEHSLKQQPTENNIIEVKPNSKEEVRDNNTEIKIEQKHSVRAELQSIKKQIESANISVPITEINKEKEVKNKKTKHSKSMKKSKLAKHLNTKKRKGDKYFER